MNLIYRYTLVFTLLAGLNTIGRADESVPAEQQKKHKSGDVLLIEHAKQESAAATPSRGMSMAQVEQRFGAPVEKLSPAGGDAPKHPEINRWNYESYIVYFERDRVIASVAKHSASADIQKNP